MIKGQADAPKISGALIQEETLEPVANARFHAATCPRHRTWLDHSYRLEIKDNACLPASRDLFDGDLMIGHSFDFCINGMTGWVERFTSHCGSQVRWLELRTMEGAAQQTLG